MNDSPFLAIDRDQWICWNELAFAVFDGYPVSPGHSLVVTRRIVTDWFEASPEEQAALMALVQELKAKLDDSLNPVPDGYNVGFNCGEAAGQTVMHLHIHVIPRYSGDLADPRGGVRHVIPAKGNYLASPDVSRWRQDAGSDEDSRPKTRLCVGHPDVRLWDRLSNRMAGAQQIDVVVSFVQPSGLDVIERRLFETLRRNVRVRILVSDYLYISDPRALRRLHAWQDAIRADPEILGELEARLVEVNKLKSAPDSFHPKAWRIDDESGSFVAVGSSNLSRPALVTGVEWNLLYSARDDAGIPSEFAAAFDNLWESSSELSTELVLRYDEAARRFRREHFEAESLDQVEIPDPRPWQQAALRALQEIRSAGYRRAMVSVATGMGKTWLAAFDVDRFGGQLGRRPRVLVIAHRTHILAQAESVLATLLDTHFPAGSSSWYVGSQNDLAGELVFASVQKLSRPRGLQLLASERFDYVVVDEVHHAEAPTYRRVLAKVRAEFILGLTATPERADGVDVVSIFDDNLAYHASIGDGIREHSLVPFHYLGIRDTVDFRQVPWRNGKFDQAVLETRVAQSDRMDRLWQTLQEHPADRTLVFCCSRRHALFARNWLREKGITSAAVFSGTGGDPCADSLEDLESGRLQTLCVVDMFNEGLDIPAVDRVVMLRPTESKVVFLQQLGRGLRASSGKSRLLVIDFVGNHRIFAQRMLHLLSLSGKTADWKALRDFLRGGEVSLPDGCLLDVEIEARDVLKQFIPTGAAAGIEAYRGLRDELGRRPTPSELLARELLPSAISRGANSWFDFTNAEGDLSDRERQVLESFGDWLKTVQTTSLNGSYKMVVLRVLLDESSLFQPVDLDNFALRCRRFMLQHPVLRTELLRGNHAVDHVQASNEEWTAWWLRWPISRWTDVQNGRRWFVRDGNTLRLAIECEVKLKDSLESMTEELVDWRLAAHIRSRGLEPITGEGESFNAKVSHANGRPILFLPNRNENPGIPVGPTVVQLPNGQQWEFKFVKVACNVARPAGETANRLPELLREWFGANAGVPGTDFRVGFARSNGRWSAQPQQAQTHRLFERSEPAFEASPTIDASIDVAAKYSTHLPVYDLRAAAGGFGESGAPAEVGWIAVSGQRLKPGMFVAQVVGSSMEPTIPNGSWCMFRPCPAGTRHGRLLLVQLNTHSDPDDGGRYTVKRYRSSKRETEDGWQHQTIELEPLNPAFDTIVVDEETAADLRVLGEFVAVLP